MNIIKIPTLNCLNLAMAVGTVLYDRHVKLDPDALMDMFESEGWAMTSLMKNSTLNPLSV